MVGSTVYWYDGYNGILCRDVECGYSDCSILDDFVVDYIMFLEKIKWKQYLDILDANLSSGGFVIELKTLNYSICRIPSTVLKIIAWSDKEKWGVVWCMFLNIVIVLLLGCWFQYE